MTYIFRREDNDQTIEVDFSTMMQQDAAGFLRLPDGTMARRCRHLEQQEASPARQRDPAPPPPIISDAMGVTRNQVKEFRANAKAAGFSGVEFVRDPTERTFYQCKISSEAEKRRYMKYRGLIDRNGKNGGGATMTPDQFERAKQKILQSHAALVVDTSTKAGQDGDC